MLQIFSVFDFIERGGLGCHFGSGSFLSLWVLAIAAVAPSWCGGHCPRGCAIWQKVQLFMDARALCPYQAVEKVQSTASEKKSKQLMYVYIHGVAYFFSLPCVSHFLNSLKI